jgi:hypothetical protein
MIAETFPPPLSPNASLADHAAWIRFSLWSKTLVPQEAPRPRATIKAVEHAAFIEMMGGTRVVARLVRVRDAVPTIWRRNGIPARYWHRLARIAQNQGSNITANDLFAGAPQPSIRTAYLRMTSSGRTPDYAEDGT